MLTRKPQKRMYLSRIQNYYNKLNERTVRSYRE